MIPALKAKELDSENKQYRASFLSKATVVKEPFNIEPLSEEEAIEEEMERSYFKQTQSFKRKLKPALFEESERKLLQNNCLQSSVIKDISSSNKIRNLAKIGAYASIAGLAGLYATEVMAGDVEVAAKGALRPIRNILVFAEPYLLGIAGMVSLYFAEGDGFRKTIKTGAGVVSMWGLSQALISWMPVIANP